MSFPLVDGVEVVVLPPADVVGVPNFEHPQRTGQVPFYLVLSVGFLVAFAFFAQRIYSHLAIQRRLCAEDYSMIAAFAIGLASHVLYLYAFATGLTGVHIWEMSLTTYNRGLAIWWTSSFTYILLGEFTKLSVLFFFLRADATPASWHRPCTLAVMGLTVCYMVATFTSTLFSCQPISKVIDVRIQGRCLSLTSLNIATSVWDGAIDFVLLTLSFNVIRWPRLSVLERCIFVFFQIVGILNITVTVIRSHYLIEIYGMEDATWKAATVALVAVTKTNISIVYGCIPTLGVFFRHFFPELDKLDQSQARFCHPYEKPGRMERILKPIAAIGLASVSSNEAHSARCEDDAGTSEGPRFFEENPRDLSTRSWQQQVARDYHSQLAEGWWEEASQRNRRSL